MKAISDNLIHFLAKQQQGSPNEQLEIFRKIIEVGLRLKRTPITFGDGGSVDNYIVCFTDIPLSLCDEHVAVYGKFGLGFKKSSIKQCGGAPARYFIDYPLVHTSDASAIDNRGAMYANLCSHFKLVKQLTDALHNDPNLALFDQQGKPIVSNEVLKDWVNKTVDSSFI